MAKIEHIKNKRGEVIYPVSKEGAIYDENGVLLSTKIATFITRLVDNLANYYLKSETYTKGEVDELIGAIQGFTYIVVSELPTASAETMGIVYLVPSEDPQTQNVKDEYITIRSGVEGSYTYSWEQIGSTAIDLSGYVTTDALNTELAKYTTTANLTTLLAAKQDTIADLTSIRNGASLGATAYQKPNSGIPASDIAAGVIPDVSGKQDVIPDLSTIRSGAAAGATAYQKPQSGIPKTDLESGVQDSLELADSAVQADPVGSVTPPVTPSDWATTEQVEELEAKVDDLSTGKYYGYFAQEEDLPEANVDGFAYVGEGPTYTIYNLRGGVWTSSEITVNQSPIGNDEDINQNEDGKLQFANRTYNAQQPNGMGYKILRKDATFAEQVTDIKTIYEIRYAFDLNGEVFSMPDGCEIRFNGGKLSNGTLVGNNTAMPLSGEKVFDTNIVLSGSWRNVTIPITSFGAVSNPFNSVTGKLTTTHDSTDAIQTAINTGLPVLVPAGNFYVSATIIVPHLTLIFGEEKLSGFDGNYYTNANRGRETYSRIFTDTHITIFDVRGTVSMKDFLIDTVDVPITANDDLVFAIKINTYYDNANSVFDLSMYGNRTAPFNLVAYYIDIDQSKSRDGYVTNNHFLGDIVCAAFALYVPKPYNGSSRWITDVVCLLNTRARCAHYLRTGLGYYIGGVLQSQAVLPTANEYPITLLDGASNITIGDDARYYDVNPSPTQYGGFYIHSRAVKIVNRPWDTTHANYEYPQPNVYYTPILISLFESGIVEITNKSVPGHYVTPLQEPIFDCKGISLPAFMNSLQWENGVLLGADNNYLYRYSLGLDFVPDIKLYDNGGNETTGITLNGTVFTGGPATQAITGTIVDGSYIEYSGLGNPNQGIFILRQYRVSKIRISRIELYSGTTLKHSADCMLNNVQDITYILTTDITQLKIRLYLENYAQGTVNEMRFSMLLLSSSYILQRQIPRNSTGAIAVGSELLFYGTKSKLSLRHTGVNSTFEYLLGFNGTTVNLSNVVTSPRTGTVYFNTTTHKPQWFYAGIGWKEADGEAAQILRSGLSSQRPVPRYVGFCYFDKTLGKPIWAKDITGSVVTWVDATGTTV